CWRRNVRAVEMRICWEADGRKSISARPRLGGQAEPSHGDRGAEYLRGAARDRVAEARQVRVRDPPAELRARRAVTQRPPEPEQVHTEPRELLTGLVGIDLRHGRRVGVGRAVAD